MINILFQNPLSFLLIAALLIIAISVHEFSHAFVADKLGDPTPKLQGRLTLDPKTHLDPLGTLLLFFVGFGWGKPVQFDPFNLRNPKKDTATIAFAGPFSNLILAVLASLFLRIVSALPILILSSFMYEVLSAFIYFNVLLAVFNLLPIHPLDGFNVVAGLIPKKYYPDWLSLSSYGIFFLFLLILPFGGKSALHSIISPIINFVLSVLLPSGLGGII